MKIESSVARVSSDSLKGFLMKISSRLKLLLERKACTWMEMAASWLKYATYCT